MKVKMPLPSFPFTPAQDYLVLSPAEEDTTIDLGDGQKLYLPDTGKRPLNQGTIVAIGKEATKGFEIGDTVIFPLHQEERLKVDRQQFYLLREELVMCFKKEEPIAK